MIQLNNIGKYFGSQTLFESVTFKVGAKERVGLVGRNGHGKTTLVRIISGELDPDEGYISIPKHYSIGYLKQHLKFEHPTIIAECAAHLKDQDTSKTYQAEKILMGLGFLVEDFTQSPSKLSGGFQVRLSLANVLVAKPNLLLLDEPTNYLDILSIRWLANFLRNWESELLLITHDRGFMDQVITHTIGIHRLSTKKIKGTTEKYYNKIMEEEDIHEKTRLKDEKRRKEITRFISRFRAQARHASLAQSRVKMLSKQETKDKLSKIDLLDFSFKSLPFHGKSLIEAHNIYFSYVPDTPLIENFYLSISKTDRIGVIGKNGKGKTTLMNLLAKEFDPNSGKITFHPNLELAYFGQTNIQRLHPEKTVEEELWDHNRNQTYQTVRNILGTMMFSGDSVKKKIDVLSGGEKSRVLLGKLLSKPAHLLLLDEPTNHLDMESIVSLLDALEEFEGAAIIVTHNESILHAIINKLIVFQKDKVTLFNGTYQEFLDTIGWQDEQEGVKKKSRDRPADTEGSKLSKKELRKKRSAIIQERSKIIAPLKKLVTEIESKIANSEAKLEKIKLDLIEASQKASQGDQSSFATLSKNFHSTETEIETLYSNYDKMVKEIEKQSSYFEDQLKDND